jgi:hypothetical protein
MSKIELSTAQPSVDLFGGDNFNYRTKRTNETIPKAIKIFPFVSCIGGEMNRIMKVVF